MTKARLVALTGAALVAFAGNSLLCRGALGTGRMDPATFTAVRLAAGAVLLALLPKRRAADAVPSRSLAVGRAVALFGYATLFSWSYVRVPAGVGALVLFAAVQLTMIGWAVRRRSGPRGAQWVGVALALGGLGVLTLPGASAPDPVGVILMAGSGAAWAAYSILGRRGGSPVAATATSFLFAAPLSLVLLGAAATTAGIRWDGTSLALGAASGALASGLGYVLWYAALPHLEATNSAVVQLVVPLLAAAGGVLLLGEPASARLAASATAVLGGIALVLRPPAAR